MSYFDTLAPNFWNLSLISRKYHILDAYDTYYLLQLLQFISISLLGGFIYMSLSILYHCRKAHFISIDPTLSPLLTANEKNRYTHSCRHSGLSDLMVWFSFSIVCIGVLTPLETPLFFAKSPWNLQTVPAPLFRQFLPIYWFFVNLAL